MTRVGNLGLLCCRVIRHGATAVSLIVMLLVARSASAEPCCVSQLCQALTPPMCQGQGGIASYCLIGQACGAATCDGAAIQPIQILRCVKTNSQADVKMVWQGDPNADSYNVWYVDDKTQIPAGIGDPAVAVTSPMTTIPEIIHAGAVTGSGGDVNYYDVAGACVATPAVGACCDPAVTCTSVGVCCTSSGSCLDSIDPATCAATSGTYHDDWSTCAQVDCRIGACCLPLAGCIDAIDPATCVSMGGLYQGGGTLCSILLCL